MMAKIFRPAPHPGVALFGIVLLIFGIMASFGTSEPELSHLRPVFIIAGAALLLTAAILLINFARGLYLDLTVTRDGLTAAGRIVSVEKQHGGKGFPSEWWLIEYSFVDAGGVERRGELHELDTERGAHWKVGDPLKLRYHRDAPSIVRWLD